MLDFLSSPLVPPSKCRSSPSSSLSIWCINFSRVLHLVRFQRFWAHKDVSATSVFDATAGLFLTYVYVWCMERYKRAVLGSEIASPHNRPSTLALLWAVCFPGRKIHELAGHSAGRAGGGKSGRSPRNVRPTVFLMPNLVKDGPAALGEAPDGDRVSATSGSGGGISIASPLVPGHGAVDWVGRPPLAPAAGAHAVSAELPLWAAANASGRSQSVPLALPTVSQTANDSEVGRLAHA